MVKVRCGIGSGQWCGVLFRPQVMKSWRDDNTRSLPALIAAFLQRADTVRDEEIVMLYDIEVTTIDGKCETLDAYRGKALLIVNVASQCGFTPQYAGLEKLYRQYRDQGLVVLGFPCNQFGHQEPGGEAEIREFCSTNYDVTFPLFAKIDVNGPNTHPLYRHLKSEQSGLLGERIKWNFTKFLVDRTGQVRKRYAPTVVPERISEELPGFLSA
jgi:glutathione peroxidase